MKRAFVSEIFPTIQGEGPYTGEKQVFVRLAGCPLRCDYCDTPGSLETKGHPQLTVDEVFSTVEAMAEQERIGTVSFTGGEPLMQAGFLEELFPRLKRRGLKIYLETAGVHADGLRRLIEFIDVVSMDVKMKSATSHNFLEQHQEFLSVAGAKAFAKIVIETSTTVEELEQAIELLANASPIPVLILQPVTPIGITIQPPAPKVIEDYLQRARRRLPDVRLMKQEHKAWGIR